ncbi:hypothetical protein [Streptomyces jumonjinensis]|uniref:Uncharacterized protein n=1 Tax=Streptomyces jumonjinensis TaxID=1945 RepID=A0A646KNC3_STRJU|nr:hypothetical protein [Streptomyces jumonjinensis]MQT03580.1 hypothetical protein [Streptomyces jumonjinensis]
MSYESARDLPSFLELELQLKLLRLLRKGGRKEAASIETQLREMAETIDAFYQLLGEKHWILHDRLSLTAVRSVLAAADGDADRAEQLLIEHYHDPERLTLMLLPLWKLPAMRRRLDLVDKARRDYFDGRFYATVHVLLSVMDGFVNEFENVRRGLHARKPEELHAWDSVVGHHLGLAHAHKTFTKGRSATQEEPVYELYRNGIVHGSILNYDNVTVATKAFNRLLAVSDWAVAREKEQQHQAEEPPTWSSVGRQFRKAFGAFREQAKVEHANRRWKPVEYLPGSENFTGHPLYQQTHELLTCWKRRNYGSLSDLMTHGLHRKHGKSVRSEVRRAFEPFPLADFEIREIRHDMAAAGTVLAVLDHSGGQRVSAELRWVREDAQAYPCPEPMPGQWRLVFQPREFLTRATPLSVE